jgi:nucleotide-binding universal stress UspA family protein
MRAVVWIAETTWEACVDAANDLVPHDGDITLLHVAPSDVEELAASGRIGLLGRRPPPPPGPPLRAIAAAEAEALLSDAQERLGRPARTVARRGRVEREVVEACAGSDLLVLARDGEHRLGPKSLGHHTRFVVDHAPCRVLLVWTGTPPGIESMPRPPHEAGHPPPPHGPDHPPPPPHDREHPPPHRYPDE